MNNSPVNSEATIMVVDDDEMVRRMLDIYLSRRHFKVLKANDAPEALEMVRASKGEQIDILITDIGLPSGNGFDLAESVRAQMPGIKFLFLSGSNETELKAFTKPDGNWEFLRKPCSPLDVGARVLSLLGMPTAKPAA